MPNHLMRIAFAFCACVMMGAPADAQSELSVMSFNIRYGTANDGANAWNLRRDLVVETIKDRQPDILGVQECLKFQADYLAAHLPEYDHFGVGREANGGGERMEVFYRSAALIPMASGHFWLSESPEVPGSKSWNAANVRMATWARFRLVDDGRELMFLNTHLDHRSEDARVAAARMLVKWMDGVPAGMPIVVTGDFNATAEQSVPWEILTGRLKDAWLAAAERVGPPVTWSAFKAPADQNRRIDWILVSGEIDVRLCETVTYNADGRYPSDHYPIFARVK